MTGFNDAQREYGNALAAVQADDARRCSDAYQSYLEGHHQAQIEFQQACDATLRKYQDVTREAEESREGTATAYLTFVLEVSRAQMAAARSVADLARELEGTLSNFWFESQDAQRKAYEEYVRALQSAWADVRVDALDPRPLAWAAQNIAGAAAFAASTLSTEVGGGPAPKARASARASQRAAGDA
jgi:uncharacterized protein with PIN domain